MLDYSKASQKPFKYESIPSSTHTHTHIHTPHAHIHTYVRTHHIHTYVHIRIHTHAHTCTHARMHTHTHTNTLKKVHLWKKNSVKHWTIIPTRTACHITSIDSTHVPSTVSIPPLASLLTTVPWLSTALQKYSPASEVVTDPITNCSCSSSVLETTSSFRIHCRPIVSSSWSLQRSD